MDAFPELIDAVDIDHHTAMDYAIEKKYVSKWSCLFVSTFCSKDAVFLSCSRELCHREARCALPC
jgi:hypothetical protein